MTEETSVLKYKIEQESPDVHVFAIIECPDRPTISLDLRNVHGRRVLGIRLDGMSTSSLLVDISHLDAAGERIDRFCPYCGDMLSLVSAQPHVCSEELGWERTSKQSNDINRYLKALKQIASGMLPDGDAPNLSTVMYAQRVLGIE